MVYAVVMMAGAREERVFVVIVRERRGTLSFLVRRREAEKAVKAERSARCRCARGQRRFMALLAAADWIV